MTTEECAKRPSTRPTKTEEGNSYWLEFSIAVTIFFLGVLILVVSS